MFSRSLAAFLQYAPFDFSRVTRPARKPFVGGEALKWPGDMKLSARMERPGDYAKLQRARRDALESILREEPTEQSVRDAVDLICAILEESSWALIDPNEPFDDETFPPIDFSCAETAALFGWTACKTASRCLRSSVGFPSTVTRRSGQSSILLWGSNAAMPNRV